MRRVDSGDIDLLHRHHPFKGALCFIASGRHRFHERARSDLPGDAPAVPAPAALALLAAVAGDGIPVAVRFFLIVRRDRKRKGFRAL
jgi:hypothetical protein